MVTSDPSTKTGGIEGRPRVYSRGLIEAGHHVGPVFIGTGGLAGSTLEGVALTDAVKNKELPDFYRLSGILALPSYFRSFSSMAAEAMAHLGPVVGTTAGGLPKVVEKGKCGILVRFRSVYDSFRVDLTLTKRPRKVGNGRQRTRPGVEHVHLVLRSLKNRRGEGRGSPPMSAKGICQAQ